MNTSWYKSNYKKNKNITGHVLKRPNQKCDFMHLLSVWKNVDWDIVVMKFLLSNIGDWLSLAVIYIYKFYLKNKKTKHNLQQQLAFIQVAFCRFQLGRF